MGAGGARNGGGGGPPSVLNPPKKKFEPPVVKIIKGVGEGVSKFTKKKNLERRKKFIKSQGLTEDDIRMDDAYLSSEAGLKELKKQGYTTVADTSRDRGNGLDPQYKPSTATPTTMAKTTAPTTAEVSQATATTAEAPVTTPEEIAETEEERKRKTKRRGRSLMVITSSQGVDEKLTLGKPSLLGS